jgi:hypothetical protein
MKTKILLFIGAVALVTLSFTFASVETPKQQKATHDSANASSQIGGLVSDEVVK